MFVHALILKTKLYIPPSRPKVLLRPRLIKRLNEGLHRKLTLISAPAGFGKTTQASEWLTSCERPAAWLSLDEGDNEPTRFLAYLVAALQTLAPNIGEGLLALLRSPQPPPTEALLTALLNEITTISDHFILVLDDYHVIDAKAVDNMLTFLLDHLPPQMHLVITTREDPPLPLARYRARGQMTELRAADLRFKLAEAAGFLNQAMGLTLSVEEIAALESRTEGWIAGLQMAALSMQGRAETASFIQAFTGSHHFILDYLVEEVLQRQLERVRNFLLQTAILDRLTAPLCNAVTGQEDGQGMLEALERGNLFVLPLDDQRQWYRYHHLFADVLQARLMKEQPSRVSILHQRASEWYEQNGLLADAVRHALAGKDFERAADLIELAWPAMHRSDLQSAALGWLEALPDEQIRARPVLSVGYAWELLNSGELEAADSRLRDAERWLERTTEMSERPESPMSEMEVTEMVIMDEEEFRSLPAEIASARAYHALALGDVPATVTYAGRALDLLPEGDYIRRGPAAALLGLAYWASGELEAAHRTLADAMSRFQMAGNLVFAISCTYGLADIRIAQGRLHEAIRIYEQSLQLATAQDEPLLQGTADLYLGLSELHREQGNLEAARQHLLRSKELGEQAALPDWPYRLCRAQARIKEAEGDLDGALDLLDEAERLYYRTPVPDVRPIAALKARLWVAQGRLTEVLSWVRERGLSVDDDLSYLREFEHITLVRVQIARYKSTRAEHDITDAMNLLERLLQAALRGARTGSVIAILLLQALAHSAQGNIPPALVSLERALTLAEPQGYVRLFVDEGPPMTQLLLEAAARGIMPDYTGKLLAASSPPVLELVERRPLAPSKGKSEAISPPRPIAHLLHSKSPTPPAQPLIEPLSQRELRVLQLIAQGLSNREISERLFLALSTVKGYNRRIYGKLGVQRRTEAVARARELALL